MFPDKSYYTNGKRITETGQNLTKTKTNCIHNNQGH